MVGHLRWTARLIRSCLTAVIGKEAFRAFLMRALVLATREDARLVAIGVREDGTLEEAGGGSPHAGEVLINQLVKLQTNFAFRII